MHKWREKHPDYPNYSKKSVKKRDTTFGELSDGPEDADAAADIYSVAEGHRATVIAKDKAAAARKKKGARRG